MAKKRELVHVSVDQVDDQEFLMRGDVDAQADRELLESVRQLGVIVPILVRQKGEGFSIVAGHRRLAAATGAGLKEIPAYIFDGDDRVGWSAAFAENFYRKDLSPIEEAAIINDCLTVGGFSIEQLASAFGRSPAWISDRVELIDWPENLSFAVHLGKLSVAAARNLVRITDSPQRSLLVDYAVDNGATARTTAAWLQAWRAGTQTPDPGDTKPEAGRTALPPITPYTPCVICGLQEKMTNLSYAPTCPVCSELIVAMARKVREGQV